jgi:hypothetical protein
VSDSPIIAQLREARLSHASLRYVLVQPRPEDAAKHEFQQWRWVCELHKPAIYAAFGIGQHHEVLRTLEDGLLIGTSDGIALFRSLAPVVSSRSSAGRGSERPVDDVLAWLSSRSCPVVPQYPWDDTGQYRTSRGWLMSVHGIGGALTWRVARSELDRWDVDEDQLVDNRTRLLLIAPPTSVFIKHRLQHRRVAAANIEHTKAEASSCRHFDFPFLQINDIFGAVAELLEPLASLPAEPPYLDITVEHTCMAAHRCGQHASFGNRGMPWKLFLKLLACRQQGASRRELAEHLWPNRAVTPNTLDQHLLAVRNIIEPLRLDISPSAGQVFKLTVL